MIRLHDLDLDLSATSVPAPDRAATRVLLAQRLGQPAAGTGAAQGAHGGPGVDCALPALTGLGVGAASDHWLGGDADLPTQAGETAVAELIDAATDHPAVAHATVRWRQRGDWLAAAKTAGATAGKMISPQSIAVATAATGIIGSEGKILQATLKVCAIYVIIIGLVVYFGAPLMEGLLSTFG